MPKKFKPIPLHCQVVGCILRRGLLENESEEIADSDSRAGFHFPEADKEPAKINHSFIHQKIC